VSNVLLVVPLGHKVDRWYAGYIVYIISTTVLTNWMKFFS